MSSRAARRRRAKCRAKYWRAVELGLCWRCPEKAHTRGLCAFHAERQKLLYRQRYQRLKVKGACPKCGDPCSETTTLCEYHRKLQSLNQRDCERRTARTSRLKKALIAAGRCPSCGKPSVPGIQLCERHRQYNIVRCRQKRAAKKAA